MHSWIVVLNRVCTAVAVLAILAPFPAAVHADPSVLVTVTPLKKGNLPKIVTGYGTTAADPSTRTSMTAPLAATVEHIFVRSGETVTKGEPLIRLVPDPQTQLSYAVAISALQNAQNNLAHTQQLYKQYLATKQDLANAKKSESDAQSALTTLKAQGAQGPRDLKAPFHAIVTQLLVNIGDHVAVGTPLFNLVAPDKLMLHVGVTPGQAASIAVNDKALIKPAGQTKVIHGRVKMRGGAVENGNGLVPVYISLPPDALLPGQTAEVSIETGTATGYVVPHTAVLVDDAGKPYVVQAVHMAAKTIPVRVLNINGDMDLVAGPLVPGAPVVLSGNYQLKNGMNIRFHNPQTKRNR